MANFRKFLLLLWKNYILQKRHRIQTAVEILVPVFFTGLLVLIRALVKSELIEKPTIFPSFYTGELMDFNDIGQTPVNNNITKYGPFECDEIIYYPNNPFIRDLMEGYFLLKYFTDITIPLNSTHKLDYTVEGFATEEAMVDYYHEHSTKVLAGISFKNIESTASRFPAGIEYSLRFPARQTRTIGNDEKKWNTEYLYPFFQALGPRKNDSIFGGPPNYYLEGFLYLQHALDESITRNVAGIDDDVDIEFEKLTMQRFPYPSYIDDVFLVALQTQLPFILLLSFIYPCINITKSIVHEKEKRLKESMKIMGLPNYLHWTAWFLKSLLFLLFSVILMATLMKIRMFKDGQLGVITYGNGFLLFLFGLSYAITVISLSFLISTLFSTANSASTAAGVIFFLIYFPFFFLQPRYSELDLTTKIISSLLSNTAMAYGCQIIAMFEGTGAGIQWETIADSASPDDTMSILHCLIMMWVDSLLYMILAWYIEGVRPGDYGVPLPWYFPVTKWYWFGNDASTNQSSMTATTDNNNRDETRFESEPRNSKAGIQIKNLTKVFNKKVAVKNLSLNMYEDQITALLGHNGAGKTTTMSMLTGIFPPTSGTALLNGYDIGQEIQSVRGSLGLCPQHDVLFDELTVQEHLQFFCQMKGMNPGEVSKEIDRLLKALNLEPKRHAEAQTLSGGMKRKLSVAIALCGNSKVVLLDEPTSGMDPGARRAVWDLLQQEKKNRTLVLSTHFMEEADVLGDRIAIMAEGKARCVGSSLFLKKKYGGGYHLVIVKEPHCQVQRVTALLQKTIPDVAIDQNVGAELSYSLPDNKSSLFPDMFQELESRKRELGIASYGASITTMEEVFMKVGREAEAQDHALDPTINTKINIETLQHDERGSYKLYQKVTKNEGFTLLMQQLQAMFVKKMLYSIRNRLLLIFQTAIPVFILIITLLVVETAPGITDAPGLELKIDGYKTAGNPITLMSCMASGNPDSVCRQYEEFVKSKSVLQQPNPDQTFEDFVIDKTTREGVGQFNYQYIVGMEQNSSHLNAYFNNQPFHAAPLALNFISNAILQKSANSIANTIKITNHPMPMTNLDKIDNAGGFESAGFQVGFNIAFGMAFLASSFVVFLIKERETKAKHLQFVSGVKFPIFWAANFIFDAINFIIPCILLMIVLIAFQTSDFNSVEAQGCVLLVFLLYGYAVIPQMYLFSFAFSVPSSGFTRMVLFNIFTGMASILAVIILRIESLDLLDVADALNWVFMLLPQYGLGMSIITLATNTQLHEYCPKARLLFCFSGQLYNPKNLCCTDFPRNYLDWAPSGIGRYLLALFLVGTVCITILFISEAKIIEMIRFRRNNQVSAPSRTDDSLEDSDVLAESARIRSTNLTQLFKTENLILRDLTKNYDKFLAVDKLCLGVQAGECFGLLGVNGAGKTTTFKMLTGDHPISSGDAYIYSTSVKSDIKEVQKNLGYCPQFDAIIDELTGRETITLFARLRGVPERHINPLVDTLAANLLFTEHIDKRSGAYSGGNKRKLSTAIALCGNPPLVFLDEPTTGMDPVARRHLWNAITKIRDAGTSIVLTSHSMEECEALCTRLSIMVNGKFRCLGPPQHLKNKFGEGYTLIAQTSLKEVPSVTRSSMELGRRRSSAHANAQPWEKQLNPLRNYIEGSFPGAQLKDLHPGYLQYHIAANAQVTWGEMFRKMEVAKSKFDLEAYSVGQTSLEQVFLNFTKAQHNGED